ncbi:MAG: hypothetical protein JW803_09240 [Endomicrobiales bacterium]|nr:hypothetical protein [Endomicrobiales bacterium]
MKRILAKLTGNPNWSVLDCLFVWAGVVSAVAYVWAYRFLPLQDYPDWLFQGFVFSEALKGRLLEGYRVLLYPVPNSASTLIIGFLGLVFSPEASGKIFLSLYAVIFAAGSLYMMGSLDRARRVGFLYFVPLLYTANVFFIRGNLGYMFGLGFVFFGFGYLMRRSAEPEKVKALPLAFLTVPLFFSHALAYAAFALFAAFFAVFHFKKKLAANMLAGFAPSALLAAGYFVNHNSTLFGAMVSGVGFKATLTAVSPYFSVYPYFYPAAGPYYAFIEKTAVVSIAVSYAMMLLFVYWLAGYAIGELRRDKTALFTGLFLLAAVYFSPAFYKGMSTPGERFIFPLMWLALAHLVEDVNLARLSDRVNAALKASVFGLIALQYVFLFSYGGYVSKEISKTVEVMRSRNAGREFGAVSEVYFDYGGRYVPPAYSPYLSLLHYPMIRLPYYLSIDLKRPAPIFNTGMLYYPEEDPLADSVESVRKKKYPEQVFIMAYEGAADAIAELFEPEYRKAYQDGYVTVIEKRRRW